MTKLTIDEKYAKELDKAEVDHHKPTAGAMLGHVLSNLFIENVRLTQAGIYAKSPVKCEYLREIAKKEDEYFFKISDFLLDENEIVPSTTEEFLKYHKFLDIEYIERIGKYVLYIPDEWTNSHDELELQIQEKLNQHSITKVDIAIMHGQFKYQLAGKKYNG